MTEFFVVLAASENGVIGNNNTLLWPTGSIPADMKRFRELTKAAGIVLMGRKTAESLSKPLSGRRNLVLTRDLTRVPEGFEGVTSLVELKALLPEDSTVAVIGGTEIYKLLARYCAKAYITRVCAEYEGDALFPHQSFYDFKADESLTEIIEADESNKHPLIFYTLNNQKLKPL